MYTVYLDNNLIYDLNKGEDLVLIDPQLELELNSPGTFTCTMPLNHPYYDAPQAMLSRVQVFSDGEELFTGRIIDISIDFYKQKTLTCEGELGFLNDSIQRPAEYHEMSVRGYLETLIENHNEQVEEDKQFEVGYVLVTDTNDSLYRYTNYNTTMTEIKEDLVDDLGGYIRVRNWQGHRFIDYINIDDYGIRNEQVIRFGENLLDYTNDMDTSEIATVIIPLGEKLDESPIEALDMRLTIESVNNGSDAIESEEAVKTYGRVVKTVVWDDVTLAENLKAKGEQYLKDYQWDKMVLEVGAVDLHFTDTDIEQFHLGDQIRVISDPHGLDKWFPLAQINIPLAAPDQWSLTLGIDEEPHTLTAKVATTEDSITKVEEDTTPIQKILDQAAQQATNLITAATHGYVILEPNEIYIMNAPDYEQSTEVWRWNLNGLGYASREKITDEYKYGLAMTMDGSINASYINSGTLNANVIRAGVIEDSPEAGTGENASYWDLESGTINISGTITAGSGSMIGPWTISDSAIYRSSSSWGNSSGMYFGTSGLSVTNKFTVSSSGAVTATSATITGTITAGSGSKIGGWYVGTNKFYSYNGTDENKADLITGLQDPNSGTFGLAVGATKTNNWGTAPFRVKHNGDCYASSLFIDKNAEITGTIENYGKIISRPTDGSGEMIRITEGNIDFYYYTQNGDSKTKYGEITMDSYNLIITGNHGLDLKSSSGIHIWGNLIVSNNSGNSGYYSGKSTYLTINGESHHFYHGLLVD